MNLAARARLGEAKMDGSVTLQLGADAGTNVLSAIIRLAAPDPDPVDPLIEILLAPLALATLQALRPTDVATPVTWRRGGDRARLITGTDIPSWET